MAFSAASTRTRASALATIAWTPWLVWLAGCSLAAAGGYWKHQDIRNHAEVRMQQNTDAVAQTVRERFMHPAFGLQGARGVYAASQRVPRAAFLAYVESRIVAQEFPGVRGFGFAQRVLRSDLAAFVAAERADGAPQFALRQWADTSHDDLYVVKYLEPAAGNPGDQGLDLGSDVRQRAALQRAVDSGLPTISEAIPPPQGQPTAGMELVIFVPVYAKGTRPVSMVQRRASLMGVLLAPVAVAELLAGMKMVDDGQISLELFDAASSPEATPDGPLLFGTGGPSATAAAVAPTHLRGAAPPQFSVTRQLPLLGRDFSLRVQSTTAFEDELDKTTPWLLLLGGTLLSTLVALLLRQQVLARSKAEHSRHAHIDELELQKYALDLHAIVATTDVRGRITYANDKFCEISGYSREEVLGQDHSMLNSGHHPHGFFKAMYRTVAGGATWRDEICNKAKDGHLYWVDTTIVPVMGPEGKPERYLAIRADITPRKHAEEALKLQKYELELQKYALDQHAIVATTDVRGRITYVNDKLCEISGYSREELMGQDHIMLNSGHHAHGFFKAMYRTVAAGKTWHDEVCNRAKDGHLYWVDTTIVPVMDADGKPERYLAIRADITPRKQAEEALKLQKSELELQKYALDQHAIVATTNVQGRITYVNDKLCEISGYSREELMGQDHIMLNSGHHPHGFFKAMYRTVAAGKTWHNEVCNRAKDGHLYWVDTTIVPVMDADGKPERYLAIRADITLRKQVQLDLMQQQLTLEMRVKQKTAAAVLSENYLRLVMNNSLDAIIGMDAQGCITEWSSQAETAFGWTLLEVRGKAWYQFVVPERYRDAPHMGLAHYLDKGGGPQPGKRIELLGLHKEGREFPIELAISPIVTPQGTSYSAFISDISQHKHEQAELLAAKALAESASRAKSQFLANMSHEIRTPMNGVVGMVDILQKSSLLPQQRRMLGTIENSAMALLQILNDILDFSKIEAGMFSTEMLSIRLRDVVEGVTDLLASGVGAQADLVLSIDPELPQWCLGDPTRLRQVLLNLMGNAIKFSSRNGNQRARVSLSVAPCVLESGANGVRIAVADNGIGMPPEVVSKLFQPFTQADESTSRKFGGTGLGLSITRALVELMGGTIHAKSTLGVGSEFVVDLPLQLCAPGQDDSFDRSPVERRVSERTSTLAPDAARQAGLMILLAEDNEINREVMQEQLRLLGYPCESAEDGAIALRMWQANPGRYGLLLSDCHMPNLDGFGLTKAIRAMELADTRLPIIAVTANAMQGEAQRCLANGMDDYLSKPLRLDELQKKLAQWMPVAAATALEAPPATAPEAAVALALPPVLAIWTPATLTSLVGDNPGMHKRLLGKFLVNVEHQVAQIVQFAAARDTHSLTGVAHTAKSAARSVGALALGELCQSLETAGRDGDSQRCSALAAGLASEFAAASAAISSHLGL